MSSSNPWPLFGVSTDPRRALNDKHAADPQPGDYWHEMFCPIRIVLAVHKDVVVICDKTKATDKHHWTWDLDQVDCVMKKDFAKKLKYSSGRDGFHCDVEPGCHIAVVEHYEGREK